ncbi:MAG: glycosyltransferase [Phenylobacterium sp.]|uniref:glycosyltransferase n=1 Tax=Phenylobacterium sp. TaxID=1871053 RepID=UPI001A5DD969|nr:glycosyltransferase [Phenylobacterium sp.]MBL8556627.1 glycosyltransferase [Phenylobacterium sp.]
MTTATEFGEARPRLLYLTQELPFADDAGHKIRSRQLIEALVRSFDVTVAGFIEDGTASSHRLMGCRVIAERAAVRIRRQPVRLAQAIATAIVRNRPYSLGKFDNRRLFRTLRADGESASPAIVVANLAMAGYLDAFPRAVRIIDAHNVEAALWRDFQAAAPPMARPFVRREARLLEGVERAAWAGAQGVIAICAEDGRTIVSEAPDARVLVAPPALARQPPAARGDAQRADVGMLGVWSWAPNEHALETFAADIAPALRESGMSMRVTGPGVGASIRRRLERLGVEVTGAIPDVRDFYAAVDQVAAPYFQGGGVRLKVLEAIACEVPLVGSPLAFRGILGREATIGDVAPDTQGLVRLLLRNRADMAAARRRAGRLRQAVAAAHDPDRTAEALNGFLSARLRGD